ncbi:MAG TPA: FtsQ-type POTRA domain-containing protein [Thermoanaerobaculia bacterium]|nr:FtsQ-type POTRA domain-containing protein [Thermoanaerobaculia bacterium]
MSTGYESARYFRPADASRVRRNQRRINVQRLLLIARNTLIVAALAYGALWGWRHIHSDSRYAVKHIEVEGVQHTPRAAIDAMTRRYAGLNLFNLDIARIQQDLGDVAWIRRIEVEKNLPDTLKIKISERSPVALAETGGQLRYVDDLGVVFADLSPDIGDADLPLIANASGAELVRCVKLLQDLRTRDPQIYAHISEIQPVAPNGFRLFDRYLDAVVYANGDDLSGKLRSLYAVARTESFGKSSIEYADLRFADRIIIKPVHPIAMVTGVVHPKSPALITN